jgi:hypothetical protein
MTNYIANPSNIENLSNNELREIKAFVKGLIAGIKDTHKEPNSVLEDYWHAWDNTIDINIFIDESNPQRYLVTLYSVWNNEIDYGTFQRLDYLTDDLKA